MIIAARRTAQNRSVQIPIVARYAEGRRHSGDQGSQGNKEGGASKSLAIPRAARTWVWRIRCRLHIPARLSDKHPSEIFGGYDHLQQTEYPAAPTLPQAVMHAILPLWWSRCRCRCAGARQDRKKNRPGGGQLGETLERAWSSTPCIRWGRGPIPRCNTRSVVLQQVVTVCDVALRLFSQCGHALSAHFPPNNAR